MTLRAIKSSVRSMAARGYWASPRFLSHLAGKVLILMYHRVMPVPDAAGAFVQPGMYVTPETFDRHLRFLSARFQFLSFADLLARWDQDRWDSTSRQCVLTFDDGWYDNYVHAYPLLRAYGVPATIFLPTDFIGTTDWLWPDRLGYLLDRQRDRARLSQALAPLVRRYPALAAVSEGGTPEALDKAIEVTKTISDGARDELLQGLGRASGVEIPRQRRFLAWDEAREMSRHGIEFGSHSCSHAMLTRLDASSLRCELRRSLDVLRCQRVNHVPVLSYPNGDYSDPVLDEARAAGYRAAVTTEPGIETRCPADPFRLRRIGVHEDVSRTMPLLGFHVARRTWWSASAR